MGQTIHIVTRFDGTGGTEHHASELYRALRFAGHSVKLWSDRPRHTEISFGATAINSFAGQYPRGGTLIMVGTHQEPGIWLNYAQPRRLIVICNLFSIAHTFGFLAFLDRPSLPDAEYVFVSSLLRDSLALPGIICPPLINLADYQQQRPKRQRQYFIGRHSRDDISKHHPDDLSIWRMLAWQGYNLRLMGANHLRNKLHEIPTLEILDVEQEQTGVFLAQLDCFFYRTAPGIPEASGRVVIEALAAGIPVVVSENGGYIDWIDNGINGFIIENQEEAFDRIIELGENRALRSKMSQNARCSAVRRCSIEQRQSYLDWITRD
ncbi:MAG: glycosyltransferase family 4 protein [Zoogloeaceae bacterium]|nr:glycosyltransferase family 4 protein [Zoogloeaceae bacterium]